MAQSEQHAQARSVLYENNVKEKFFQDKRSKEDYIEKMRIEKELKDKETDQLQHEKKLKEKERNNQILFQQVQEKMTLQMQRKKIDEDVVQGLQVIVMSLCH